MREIKFRAWDKEEKVMRLDAQDQYDYLGDGWATTFGEVLKDSNYIVMQYTGLKDKNGKEIWEGDVVKWQTPGFQPLRKIENIGVVEWGREDKQTASWEVLQKLQDGNKFDGEYGNNQPFGLYCDVKKYEVIGNIYENPELLTNK